MARFYKILLVSLFFILISCQNEGYIGDFYGQWVLKTSCVDGKTVQHENLYFSFQGQVVMAKQVNPELHTLSDVFGKFVQNGDSLFMTFYQKNTFTSPKVLIEQQFRFEDSNNVRLYIQSQTASRMCLSSGDNTWLFTKY